MREGTWLRPVELGGRGEPELAVPLPRRAPDSPLLSCWDCDQMLPTGVRFDDMPVLAVPGRDAPASDDKGLLAGSCAVPSSPSSEAMSVIRDDTILAGPPAVDLGY